MLTAKYRRGVEGSVFIVTLEQQMPRAKSARGMTVSTDNLRTQRNTESAVARDWARLHFGLRSRRCLRLLLLADRGFGSLKADLGMRSIAKRLIDARAAAAEREGRLAGQIPLASIGIDQLH